VRVALAVCVTLGVDVTLGDIELLRVCDCELVPVLLPVAVPVRVSLCESDGVDDCVIVAVCVCERDWVCEAVGVRLGVLVALRVAVEDRV